MGTPPSPPPSDSGSAPARSLRTIEGMLRSMRIGQVVIAAVLLVFGAARAISMGTSPTLTLAASLLFAGWYAGGIVIARRTRDLRLGTWWLLGLGLVWVGTVAVSAEFVWLAFSLWLLAGSMLRIGWAIVYAIAVFAVVAVAPVLHQGFTTYANVIGPLVGGLFALGISRGYIELVRETRERGRLVASLLQAQTEMAELQEELARTQKESGTIAERTRLSRDIHDTVAQGLSSIRLLARAARGETNGDAARALDQIDALAGESLADVRRIVAGLAPAALEEGALAEAIRRMLERVRDETGIAVELQVDSDFPALPTSVEVALLRTAQSALANVRRHSGAARIVVSLADAQESVRMDVVDDGRGFDAARWDRAPLRDGSGYGLHSMRARLRELGGGLDVESTPGEGTALSAYVPVAPALRAPSSPGTGEEP